MPNRGHPKYLAGTRMQRFSEALQYRGFRDVGQFADFAKIDRRTIQNVIKHGYDGGQVAWLLLSRIAEYLGISQQSLYFGTGKLEWVEEQSQWYRYWKKSGRMPEDGPRDQPYRRSTPILRLPVSYPKRLSASGAPEGNNPPWDPRGLRNKLPILWRVIDSTHPDNKEPHYLTTLVDVARIGWCLHTDHERHFIDRRCFLQLYQEFSAHEESGVDRLKSAAVPPHKQHDHKELIDIYGAVIEACRAIFEIVAFDLKLDISTLQPRPSKPHRPKRVRSNPPSSAVL